MFDLSITKLLVLAVLALVIFGPDQLPKMAQQLGRSLRDLRRLADKAKTDLQEGLGPEFGDFDLADLHPRTFVRKHLLDDLDDLDDLDGVDGHDGVAGAAAQAREHPMDSAQRPPFDPEAT